MHRARPRDHRPWRPRGPHSVLPREKQWDLGVLRPLTTLSRTSTRSTKGPFDPAAPRLTSNGKHRKPIWYEQGIEEIGYDDLHNASKIIRDRLDYGHGSAPDLDDATRGARRMLVAEIVDRLLSITTLPRRGSIYAIDATGQWAWSRGPRKRKEEMKSAFTAVVGDATEDQNALLTAEIAVDDDGSTAPEEQAPPPSFAHGRCPDAAWGYKTGKDGKKEVGFGFHQQTIVRVPNPGEPDSEALSVDGLILTPANADVVEASLEMIDRIARRHPFTRVIGDMLYTNLKASRWATQLAARGIEQTLKMRVDNHRVVDIHGGQLQHGWLHCAAAPMHLRPMPPDNGDDETWERYFVELEKFQNTWACDRKESGLGSNPTTKWICPAYSRVGCFAAGQKTIDAAIENNLEIITPPDDYATRKICTQATVDFTPIADKPDHQRKLMQREYYGSRKHRGLMNLRSLVEGVFGIMKNPSRQRLRRGQNRLPGLAMATLIAAIKASMFNEEQLRIWHERTGRGPIDHPLLQPDPYYWGFSDLTEAQAREIDRRRLAEMEGRRSTDAA